MYSTIALIADEDCANLCAVLDGIPFIVNVNCKYTLDLEHEASLLIPYIFSNLYSVV